MLLVRGSPDLVTVLYSRGQRGARMWHAEDVTELWRCCMILHNMIFEGERELGPMLYVRDLAAL